MGRMVMRRGYFRDEPLEFPPAIPGRQEDDTWPVVIGRRVRMLRNARGLTLRELSERADRPDGRTFSIGYLSRLERGWAVAPLFLYVRIAEIFEVEPGRLLGADWIEGEVSEGEITLIRFLRRAGITPDEALARFLPVRGEGP